MATPSSPPTPDRGPRSGRYSPPTDRAGALEAILSVFGTTAAGQDAAPVPVTLAQGVTALELLGATREETGTALHALRLPTPEWCGRDTVHAPHTARGGGLCLGEAADPPRPDGHVLLLTIGEGTGYEGRYEAAVYRTGVVA